MLPESAPTPIILPPRLKLWARATRWLLALVVSFALLLALFWGLLNWLIVPRIDEFRPALERLTRQATGLQIQIGQLQARSGGLIPSFALRDVRLLDAQGQAALQLPEVLVAISPRSLLKRGLEQLVIEGAQLEIKRTADGRFWVAGIDIGSFAPSDPQPLLNWLFSQTEWALLNGSVLWRDEQQGLQTELQQVNWVMRNSGQRHHMRFDATPQTQWGDRISVRGMLRQPLLSGAAGNWRQWSGELYAELASRQRRCRPTPDWRGWTLRRAEVRCAPGSTSSAAASWARWPTCSCRRCRPNWAASCPRWRSTRSAAGWAGSSSSARPRCAPRP
jgi:uncharacterized protein YhdP